MTKTQCNEPRFKGIFSALLCCAIAVLLAAETACAGHGGGKQPRKEAILLVVFGTTVPEAMKAFDAIQSKVQRVFPKVHLRWAYTSRMIRAKLRRQGKSLDNPIVALGKLLDDRYTHIVVASFHTLPGAEFHELYQDANAISRTSEAQGKRILVSPPLLTTRERMEAVAKGLMKHVPASRKPEDAVLFMGHGSEHHPGDAVYAALNYWLMDIDSNAFVGTVEGQPRLKDILPKLKKRGVKKVYLLPFMLVAGDHARNDMCGEDAESWRSQLKSAGFEVECILKGTGQMPEIVDVWVEGIKQTYSEFGAAKEQPSK